MSYPLGTASISTLCGFDVMTGVYTTVSPSSSFDAFGKTRSCSPDELDAEEWEAGEFVFGDSFWYKCTGNVLVIPRMC